MLVFNWSWLASGPTAQCWLDVSVDFLEFPRICYPCVVLGKDFDRNVDDGRGRGGSVRLVRFSLPW